MDINIFDIFTLILPVLTSAFFYIYSIVNKNIAKKSSKESEKILIEMKQVNNATNHKIQDAIKIKDENRNTDTNELKVIEKNSIINQENDKKLDQLIHSHHSQALSQSKIQFWFSLIAAVFGFVFIIVMVCFTSNGKWYEFVIGILPGAIIEVVSVLFFSQSRETRERSSDFLNRLREDRQYEKGIAIAESISDEELKSTLKAEIALRLCGINDINIFENRSGDSDKE